jgi:hypothetical protein
MGSMTENELLEALLSARVGSEANEDALTVAQMAELTGHAEAWVRERLQLLARAGRVRCVQLTATRIDGQRFNRPGYVLK